MVGSHQRNSRTRHFPATTPSWRYCTSAHVDTQTEKVDLGIAIFPTLPELLFVVFSVADMISWFWASVFSLRRHGYSMVSGIVLDERRKWICCCLCIYLQPLKANIVVFHASAACVLAWNKGWFIHVADAVFYCKSIFVWLLDQGIKGILFTLWTHVWNQYLWLSLTMMIAAFVSGSI